MMSRFDAMYPKCGTECIDCGMLCKRSTAIDEHYASRFAFMLECLLVDSHSHWDEAAKLLDEYKAELDKINPPLSTFIGEPMPPDRKARLVAMKEDRAALRERNT